MGIGKRTIELVIDGDSGAVIDTDSLLDTPERIHAARRAAWSRVDDAGNERAEYKYRCFICKGRAYVKFSKERTWAWFNHTGNTDRNCPWLQGHSLAPDVLRALIYRGKQESPEHVRLKHFIADYLENDPRTVGPVLRDKVAVGQILQGERKRPDVACTWSGKRLVFELQLTYTFIEDIVKRDEFYRAERTHLIWVFHDFEPELVTSAQEYLYNRGNLFVLDTDAQAKTEETQELYLTCWYLEPSLHDGQITNNWASALIRLDDLQFDDAAYRPYFQDYRLRRASTEALQAAARRQAIIDQYVRDMLDFQERGGPYEAWPALKSACQPMIEIGFQHAAAEDLWFYHGIFARLLSIKHGRSIGYDTSLVGIVNATFSGSLLHAFPIALAVKIYLHHFPAKHLGTVNRLLANYRQGLQANKPTHRRDPRYDTLLAACFPELAEGLKSSAGLWNIEPSS